MRRAVSGKRRSSPVDSAFLGECVDGMVVRITSPRSEGVYVYLSSKSMALWGRAVNEGIKKSTFTGENWKDGVFFLTTMRSRGRKGRRLPHTVCRAVCVT